MNVLITGGTGMIGHHLTKMLLEKGYKVSYLSRKKEEIPKVKVYKWDIEKGTIETGALENADYVLHLAGAGIADKRWTEARKKEIIDSRVKPIELINNYLVEKKIRLKGFISASAIGYYGVNTGEKKLDENSAAGNDFLAKCTKLWETAAKKVSSTEREVSIRTGVVMSDKGGALPKIVQPIKLGIGSPLGDGKQWMSWIHIDDLCNIYLKAIEDKQMKGAYNAVAPNPVRNEEMTKVAAEVLKKPLWLPNVPAFILKLIFGEMAMVVLGGNYVVNKRLSEDTEFSYKFTDLKSALEDLLT